MNCAKVFKLVEYICTRFFFRYGSVDVASDLVSELNDLPDFGYVFAIQIEMKFFRVVRVNMEVGRCFHSTKRQFHSIFL